MPGRQRADGDSADALRGRQGNERAAGERARIDCSCGTKACRLGACANACGSAASARARPASCSAAAQPARPRGRDVPGLVSAHALQPRDAYFSKPSKEGRVVKLRLHGTNVYGGVITKEASCEINNGKLDDDWTQIHADRLGWGKKQK